MSKLFISTILWQFVPMEFFDEENNNPMLINRLLDLTQKMNEDDLLALIDMAERINK